MPYTRTNSKEDDVALSDGSLSPSVVRFKTVSLFIWLTSGEPLRDRYDKESKSACVVDKVIRAGVLTVKDL